MINLLSCLQQKIGKLRLNIHQRKEKKEVKMRVHDSPDTKIVKNLITMGL